MVYLAMLACAVIAVPLLWAILAFVEYSFVWKDSAKDIVFDAGQASLLRLIMLPIWLNLEVVCFMIALATALGIIGAMQDAKAFFEKK